MSSIRILKRIPLSTLSTFAIGGTAETVYRVNNRPHLLEVLDNLDLKKTPFRIFAAGSNIVFPDKGISLPLVQLTAGTLEKRGREVYAEAGLSLASLVRFYIQNGFAGMESFSGIPGSVGGAAVGNAGAYGKSISDYIIKVEVWHNGRLKTLSRAACNFSYRHSLFKELPMVVLGVLLKAETGNRKELLKISRKIISTRHLKYKPGLKCPGSFFKNIPVEQASEKLLGKIDNRKIKGGKIPTGYLLESVGAKGLTVGDIAIADYHGNLFINKGRGTEKQVRQLAEMLKERVKKEYGLILEEEIRYF